MHLGVSCFLRSALAASTLTHSFSRDGGLPGARIFGKINTKLDLPLNAFFLNTVIQCALACIYFGSTAAFNAFLGVSVICLGSSCFIPILLSFINRRQEVSLGRFYKGKIGLICNV